MFWNSGGQYTVTLFENTSLYSQHNRRSCRSSFTFLTCELSAHIALLWFISSPGISFIILDLFATQKVHVFEHLSFQLHFGSVFERQMTSLDFIAFSSVVGTESKTKDTEEKKTNYIHSLFFLVSQLLTKRTKSPDTSFRSLYDWSQSFNCMSDYFQVTVRFCHWFCLEPLWVEFIGAAGTLFGGLSIAFPLFAGDVLLLALSSCDLQLSLEWLTAECEEGRDENQHL